MKFSIVTPVFNGMPWLPECVESVAAQRGDVDVEHLILDGGSTDGSREWLDAHRDLGYATIFEPDAGQTDALVKGFSRATGDVFGWLNADDVLETGALIQVATAFDAAPGAVMVGGCCILIASDGAFQGLIGTPRAATLGTARWDRQPAAARHLLPARPHIGPSAASIDASTWLWMSTYGSSWLESGLSSSCPPRCSRGSGSMTSAKSVKAQRRAIRQDLAISRRNGLPLWSEAAAHELYRVYVALPMSAGRHALRAVATTCHVLTREPSRHPRDSTAIG